MGSIFVLGCHSGGRTYLASYVAIAAIGKSVERLLQAGFNDDQPVPDLETRVFLARTEDFDVALDEMTHPVLTVYFYRVDINRTMRSAWSAAGHVDGRGHLALDLHFLITPWAENAEHELRILGRAMELLEATPTLTGPALHPNADWAPGEGVQLVTGDITTEEVMRTFDSLPTNYKLSMPYLARVVRIDTRPVAPAPPATTIVRGITPSSAP